MYICKSLSPPMSSEYSFITSYHFSVGLFPMRILLLSWFFFIAYFVCMHVVLISGKCESDQQSLLLQMKSGFRFKSHLTTHLAQWSPSTDCCGWSGVDCDEAGQVIGLDLSSESISGGIENAAGLFCLRYLRSLNLAYNRFKASQIPSTLANLTNLTYLNLSSSGFEGQIPNAISGMTKLSVLDLSDNFLELENPNLSIFVQNLTELRELYLDGVNISASGNEWCQALSSSLPNLQVLSLSRCSLSGPINSSLASLRSLSKIHLEGNNLSSQVPEFLADYVNLTSLRLGSCGLYGKFPAKIFQVQTLDSVDLSYNPLLEGFLPDFPNKNASLRVLKLGSSSLVPRVGLFKAPDFFDFPSTNFSGSIPPSLANLSQLVYLDLSDNRFTGSIPPFRLSKNLKYLDLSHNALTGAISSTSWEELLNLEYVDLSYNSLIGRIPPSLFALPSLQKLQLANNQFKGQLPQFSNASSSVLHTLDLRANKIEGHFPMSVFELKSLRNLALSFNNIYGTVQLRIQRLRKLRWLDLSYNKLVVDASHGSSFPLKIEALSLASCSLSVFPELRNQPDLYYLDLSDNKISGKIPNWIWEVGSGKLAGLNVSHNLLVGLQEPYYVSGNTVVIDLHSNLLQGKVPQPGYAFYVDFSKNMFSSMPVTIGNFMSVTEFFSLSNNNLKGVIPESICNAISLKVLDLSSNNFSGAIPNCLIERADTLDVLDLQRNNLNGYISDKFPTDCALRTLNLNENQLEGMVPKSFANCKMLEVLDLGSNRLIDEFPCWLRNVSTLQVLVLRSNKFYGNIVCPEINGCWSKLQVFDLSSNNFGGRLPLKGLSNWKPMMLDHKDKAQKQLKHLEFDVFESSGLYYQDSITVTIKGFEMEVVKILTLFTSIDLSCNHFQGLIPEEIGILKSLHLLNLSHNAITGHIPPCIGNLGELESLDLSFNNLSGAIPLELASLNFLSVLNLSYNHLVGRIPLSTQLQSFSPTSFEGNEGLCGLPLMKNCTNPIEIPKTVSSKEIDWRLVLIATGFAIGFGATVTPLMFSKKVNIWYDDLIGKFLK